MREGQEHDHASGMPSEGLVSQCGQGLREMDLQDRYDSMHDDKEDWEEDARWNQEHRWSADVTDFEMMPVDSDADDDYVRHYCVDMVFR